MTANAVFRVRPSWLYDNADSGQGGLCMKGQGVLDVGTGTGRCQEICIVMAPGEVQIFQ